MLSDEEKEAVDYLKARLYGNEGCKIIDVAQSDLRIFLKLVENLQKEIEELKREKETNQQMIHLAETQILGYAQGYKDGLNKETTATEIVARERENQIIYEGMKHKINMQWVLKIRAKIEEVSNGAYDAKIVLQSLLEKE